MKHWIRLLCLSLLSIVVGTASAQSVAKVGDTEYATIEEAIEAWGAGKTLTLLADVTTTSTVTVNVNRTTSAQNWTLNLGDYTWTANGCNAFLLYAYDGAPIDGNNGLKIYANQNGGITASGKYCIKCEDDGQTVNKGYRARLEINGGTYNGSYVVYYKTSAYSSTPNGAYVYLNKSADGTEPVFNGNFGLSKCPVTINAGYFNGTSFYTYPVSSTVDTKLQGGHFKSMNAFPNPGNTTGIIYGNYRLLVKSDKSIDVTNGAPASYEASTTQYTSILTGNRQYNGKKGTYYPGLIYFESANYAIQNYNIPITLNDNVVATQDKTISTSATLTIDATAEGSSYTGNVVLANNSAKLVMKFPEGGGHYGVSVNSGTLHVEESITDGIVTRTYSRIATISNPEAKVDNTSYSTVYDAFYAVDGTTDNKTIVLQKDVTNAGIVTNGTATGGDGKTVATFDLNGKSIRVTSVAAGNNANYTLTIIDSSEGKTGTVTNSDASLFILALTGINDYSGSYTLKVQAGTWQFDPSAVNINGEIHNLVDEGYVAKDNGNGTWTVGEIPSVAKIGEIKYVSLAAAVAAASAGDVITLIADDKVSLTAAGSEVTINKPLTITGAVDENGVPLYTIYGSSNGALSNSSFNDLFLSCNSGIVTVSNVKFDGFGNEITSVMGHSPLFIGSSNQNAVIENVYISNLNCEGIHINGGTFSIKDCNIDCSKTTNSVFTKGICVVNNAEGSIENTTITGVDCDDPNDTSAAIELQGSGDIAISDCTIQTNTIGIAATPVQDLTAGTSQVTISNCTVESQNIAVYSNGEKGALTSIVSGKYSGLLMAGDNDEGLSISGGLFEDMPEPAYCAEGYAPADNTDAATKEAYPYTVLELPDVAQIGDVKYKSLQAAVDAAYVMTGDVTIELLDNIAEYAIVKQKAELNLTIDGKGKTMSSNIVVNGMGRYTGTETLTIQNIKFEGDGTDFCSGTSSFVEVPSLKTSGTPYYTNGNNYAHNITITDCSFNSTEVVESERTIRAFGSASKGGSCYNITINNVSGSNLHSLAQFVGTTGAKVTNCSIENGENFVNVNGGAGEFAIAGNTFTSAEGADGYGVRENGTSPAVLTLTDNTFTATNAVVLGKKTDVPTGTINVISGTYVGDITKTDAATGKIVISGGHFSAPLGNEAYADFIAEGYIGMNDIYSDDEAAPNGVVSSDMAVMYTAANGKVTFSKTIPNAFSTGTYKLLKDITCSTRMTPGILASDVTLDLNGHTLTSTASDAAILLSRAGTESKPKTFVIIDSSDEKGGILKVNPAVNIGIEVSGSYNQVTIGEGVTIDGDCVALLGSNQTLTVNGTINGGNDFAVATNGSSTKNATIIVNESAVLTSDVAAMYLPGNEGLTATINGGTITGGNTGIELRAGQLVVNGGDITSTTTEYSYTPNGSGTTTKGAAIAVVQHTTLLPIDAQILGGTLTGLNQIAVVDAQDNNLEGVSVKAKDDLIVTTTIPEDFKWASNDDGTSSLVPKTYVAQIGEGDAAVKYETLEDAIAAATAGQTITLLANIDAMAQVEVGKQVILDLNGKTIEYKGTTILTSGVLMVLRGGDLTVTDSSEGAAGAIKSGTNAYAAIALTKAGETGTETAKLTVNNGTLEGDYYAITGNGSRHGTEITINGGVIKGTHENDNLGIYHPQDGKLTITGGTITGYSSGVELRSGTLNVTGGAITATSESYSYAASGNGNTTVGAAIAIAQHNTGKDITVNVTGAALSGTKLISVVDTQNNQLENVEVTASDSYIDNTAIPADFKWVSDGEGTGTSTLKAREYIAAIGTTKYETLQEAVDAAGTAATTIILLTEAATNGVISGDGVVVPSGSNIMFDLNGLTYDVTGTTVGSSGTENQGFQLLKESDITFKNGTLKASSPTAEFVIQNYSNLTLEDVSLDGTALTGRAYALSNNCGTINLIGSTSITAKTDGRAFDTCKFSSYAIPTVNINTTGAITGPVEATGGKLNIENGMFNVTWVTDSHYTAGDIQISGGIFSEEPAEEYLVEGYVTSDNEDEATKDAYPYAVMTKEDAGIFEIFDLASKKTVYDRTSDVTAKELTYHREFVTKTAGNLQPWFVPFDYTVTEEDMEKYTFYKINLIAPTKDAGQVENENDVYLFYKSVEPGTKLYANKPYLVRPKEAGTYDFKLENVELKACVTDAALSVSTARYNYDFYGTYDKFGPTDTSHQWISINVNGNLFWNYANQSYVNNYRWYVWVTSNYGSDDYSNINFIFVEGDGEETTAIDQIFYDPNAEIEGFYTVGGVKLDKPVRGLNIVKYTDGRTKKVYVK